MYWEGRNCNENGAVGHEIRYGAKCFIEIRKPGHSCSKEWITLKLTGKHFQVRSGYWVVVNLVN